MKVSSRVYSVINDLSALLLSVFPAPPTVPVPLEACGHCEGNDCYSSEWHSKQHEEVAQGTFMLNKVCLIYAETLKMHGLAQWLTLSLGADLSETGHIVKPCISSQKNMIDLLQDPAPS